MSAPYYVQMTSYYNNDIFSIEISPSGPSGLSGPSGPSGQF